jgi:hypothetical protein
MNVDHGIKGLILTKGGFGDWLTVKGGMNM